LDRCLNGSKAHWNGLNPQYDTWPPRPPDPGPPRSWAAHRPHHSWYYPWCKSSVGNLTQANPIAACRDRMQPNMSMNWAVRLQFRFRHIWHGDVQTTIRVVDGSYGQPRYPPVDARPYWVPRWVAPDVTGRLPVPAGSGGRAELELFPDERSIGR